MQFPIVAAFIALLVIWLQRKWKQRVAYFHSLQEMGIPTLPVSALFGGNLFTLLGHRGIEMHRLLLKQYGALSGHYFGRLRTVVIANYSVIREIFIRRASEFPNRSTFFCDVVAEPDEFLSFSLINVKDAKWKNHRAALSRSFTDSKLENLRPVMVDRVLEMNSVVRQKEGNTDNAVSNLFKRLTLDVIGSCGFGVATNCQISDNSQLLQASERLFNSHKSIQVYLPSFMFDNLRWPVQQCMFFYYWLKTKLTNDIDHHVYMVDVCRAILQRRLQQADQEANRVDLLHSMLEHKSSRVGKSHSGLKAAAQSSGCPLASGKEFTESDIISNMVLFYEAGYETSSTALTFMAHLLTTFPLQQRRLRVEMLRVLIQEQLLKPANGTHLPTDPTDEELLSTRFSYNAQQLQQKLTLPVLRQLHWMHCFVRESMRMYPPVWNFISRTAANDDIELKLSGDDRPLVKLPTDVRISVPIIHLHYDPNYWKQPFHFRPQRFSAVIDDSDLTEAELTEQQSEMDSFKIKDCPSLKFSDNQPKDVGLEEIDSSEKQDLNDNFKSTWVEEDWGNDSGQSELKNQSRDEIENERQSSKSNQMLLKRVDPAHYLPFGAGPRHCIGMRFALLEIKLTLCMLLLNFEMEPSEKEKRGAIEVEFKSVTIAAKDNVHVRFRPNQLIKAEK